MNHIPTPETDAAWVAYQMDSTCDEGDPWGLAARLERRLTVARKALKAVKSSCLNIEQAENVAEKALKLTKPKL